MSPDYKRPYFFYIGFHCAFHGFLNKAGTPTTTLRFPIGLCQHITVTNCKYSTPFLLFPSNSNPANKTAIPSQTRKQFLRQNNLVLLDNFISPKNQEMKPCVAHKLASLERCLPLFACFPDRQHLLTRSLLNQKWICMCSAQKNDRPTHETTTAAVPVQGKSQ